MNDYLPLLKPVSNYLRLRTKSDQSQVDVLARSCVSPRDTYNSRDEPPNDGCLRALSRSMKALRAWRIKAAFRISCEFLGCAHQFVIKRHSGSHRFYLRINYSII